MLVRNFHVFCYPSHTTHWLQPADKSFFHSFKSNWNELGRDYLRRTAGSHQKLDSFLFLEWQPAVSGFRATGTWPINFEASSKAAFDPSKTMERPYCQSVEGVMAQGAALGATDEIDLQFWPHYVVRI